MIRKSRSDPFTRRREITEEMLVNNPEFVAKIKEAAGDQSVPMTLEEFKAWLKQVRTSHS